MKYSCLSVAMNSKLICQLTLPWMKWSLCEATPQVKTNLKGETTHRVSAKNGLSRGVVAHEGYPLLLHPGCSLPVGFTLYSFACAQTHAQVHVHAHTHCTHVHACACVHAHAHTHTHTHARTHTHTHTHTHYLGIGGYLFSTNRAFKSFPSHCYNVCAPAIF